MCKPITISLIKDSLHADKDVLLGFTSLRPFHICGLLLFLRPRQNNEQNVQNTEHWEATSKLIWQLRFFVCFCLFFWKPTHLEQLCQQSESLQQGAALPEKNLQFILLGAALLPCSVCFSLRHGIWAETWSSTNSGGYSTCREVFVRWKCSERPQVQKEKLFKWANV